MCIIRIDYWISLWTRDFRQPPHGILVQTKKCLVVFVTTSINGFCWLNKWILDGHIKHPSKNASKSTDELCICSTNLTLVKKCSTLPKNASTGFRKWCSLSARHIQSCSYIARPQPSCCVKNHLQSFLLQSEVKDPKLLTYQWYKFLGFQEEVMRLIWLTHIQLMRWYLPTKNYRPSPSIVIYWVLFSFALEVHCRDREGWIYA